MAQNAAQKLRGLLGGPDILVAPVVSDPLTARLAHEAGFPLGLLGGFGIAAIGYGMPDAGLIDFTEVVTAVHNTCAANPGFPIIADGDTGYGNAMNVRRTVQEFARAGAAVILIEDQMWPKKCGHYGGKREVIPREEARLKIRAAVEARNAIGSDMLILSRTDARGAMSFDEAMARCEAFAAEGADIIFAEALESEAELREFGKRFKHPKLANMMPKTPVKSRAELKAMGFDIVTYNVAIHAMVAALQQTFKALKEDDMSKAAPLAAFDEVTRLVGLNDYMTLEQRYKA
ncbi:MAG TPA: isocitrate lyase/PEP mutase family protein [Stellaceae bacterium]|jgi:2-methylisocitrate lyase-like PEP mutase family enzyme|nr:isocitrate lyase/PEP mutase family protein [Stellaceae bacterium]